MVLKLVIFDLDDTILNPRLFEMPLKSKDIIKYVRSLGYKIALVSLNAFGRMILTLENVHHLFDKVVTVDWTDNENGNRKTFSKNEMLVKVLKEFKVKPSEALVFDDCFFQVSIAQAMRMNVIPVNPRTLLRWTDLQNGMRMTKQKRRRRHSV